MVNRKSREKKKREKENTTRYGSWRGKVGDGKNKMRKAEKKKKKKKKKKNQSSQIKVTGRKEENGHQQQVIKGYVWMRKVTQCLRSYFPGVRCELGMDLERGHGSDWTPFGEAWLLR